LEQPIPESETATKTNTKPPSEWYTIASYNPKEDQPTPLTASSSSSSSSNNQYTHFNDWSSAKSHFDQLAAETTKKKGRAVLLIDCIKTKILRQSGWEEATSRSITTAIADGYYTQCKSEESLNVWDAVKTLMSVLCNKKDIYTFVSVSILLVMTSLFELQSSLLAGKVLTMMNEHPDSPSDLIQDVYPAQLTCKYILDCDNKQSPLTLFHQSIILAFIIVKCVERLVYVMNVYIHHNACDLKTRTLKKDVFKHVLRMDQNYFDTHATAEVRGGMAVNTLSNLISWNIPYMGNKIIKIMLIVYFMININTQLAILAIVSICVTKYGVLDPISKYESGCRKIERKLFRMQEQIEGDSLENIASIKMFSTEHRHIAEYDQSGDRLIDSLNMVVVLRCVREWGYGTLRVVTFGLVFYFGINIVVETGMKASELTSFFLIFSDFQDLFHEFKWHYDVLVKELPDIERFLDLMATKPKMVDGANTLENCQGEIVFKDVRFEYPSRPGEEVLKGLNLTLKPNTMTAIVGDSGAGKSTVAKLLMRLYDPKPDGVGEITFDGQPLTSITQQSLHDNIAIVNQNPDLFGTSIGENVAYGAVGEGVTQDEIERVCKLANCHDFIVKFRGGYDTFVGGRGAQLSGGQKQRIAIARAAIRNPKVLILDEATSALDAENEKLVQDALETVMQGRTTLVIAHRLSTIRSADEIICMKDGIAVEKGSHADLMANRGPYYNLISKQMMNEH